MGGSHINQAGTREPLGRERILAAALSLADREGVDALSMRRLAAELGVKAMSLYNHVENKNDILNGIVELVVLEIELPSLGDQWKDAMRTRGASAHAVLRRHPWAPLTMMTRANAGPAMLRYVDATLGCLREAGFSYEMADRAWNAMDSYVYGFTLHELSFPFESSDYSATAESFLPTIRVEDYPYFAELTRMVMEERYSGIHDFDFGLELILDGLERVLSEG